MNIAEQPMPSFEWTEQRENAAQLVALGEDGDAEIASRLGIGRSTLWNWRQSPEFMARVDSIVEAVRVTLRRRAISLVERRVDRLNRDWLRLQKVTEERAADPRLQHVPGGSTGLIVHNVKGVGKGDDFQLIDLYEVDTGLLAELRAIEKQAAQELGQWTEKAEVKAEVITPHAIPDDDPREVAAGMDGDEHEALAGDPGPDAPP